MPNRHKPRAQPARGPGFMALNQAVNWAILPLMESSGQDRGFDPRISLEFSLFALTWAQNANSSHAFKPRAARVAIDHRIATEPEVQVVDA